MPCQRWITHVYSENFGKIHYFYVTIYTGKLVFTKKVGFKFTSFSQGLVSKFYSQKTGGLSIAIYLCYDNTINWQKIYRKNIQKILLDKMIFWSQQSHTHYIAIILIEHFLLTLICNVVKNPIVNPQRPPTEIIIQKYSSSNPL